MRRKRGSIYQFKISLMGIKPSIWRCVQVPDSYTFWDLHVAIQDAMGWLDYHLHEFNIFNPTTDHMDRIGIPDEESFMDDEPTIPGWEVAICDYFSKNNASADYTYDFGDDWKHSIILEGILPRIKDSDYPACIGGARACPPEDCGGLGGYEEFIEAIKDPNHDEHESYLKWVGGSYDPEHFHPEEVKFDDPKERWKLAFEESE